MNKSLMAAGISAAFYMAPKNKKNSGAGGGGSTDGGTAGSAVGEVNMQLLGEVVKATQANSFLYTSVAHHTPMVAQGYVEVNPQISNDKGELATRATQAGVEAFGGAQQTNAQTSETNPSTGPEGAKPSFTIVAGVELPTVKRGGRSGTVYPFDSLQVGQSFFVPASNDKPNPAKSLASTVSSATARYAVQSGTKQVQAKDDNGNKLTNPDQTPKMIDVPNMVAQRVFVARSVTDGAPWGQPGVKGAGVFRTK